MTNTLRIAHISTVHRLRDPRIFYRECWSQAKQGHVVHYIAQNNQEIELTEEGITIHSAGPSVETTGGLRLGRRLRRIWKAFNTARKLEVDIYHLHDPELIPVGVLLRWVTRRVVVFDAHEDDVAYLLQKEYIPRPLRRLLATLMALNMRLAARFLSAIVVCDAGVYDLFKRQYAAKTVITAYNFPRQDVFFPDSAEKHYDLMYHGTIPRYHLECAFEVASVLKSRGVSVSWLFLGLCISKEWAFQEIERRGLQKEFTLNTQWVSYYEVVDYVRQARIGFIPLPDLPKFQTNIPTKLFEFMALGIPIVLSDLAPSRPFVGDGKCAIMVPPSDYNAYADAIEKLLNDPVLVEQMGQIGLQRVTEQYNWNNEAKVIMELYQQLLERKQ